MRRVLLVLSGLLLLDTVAQFYLAALGAFTRPATDSAFAMHAMNGMAVIPALALLTAVAAAISRAPRKTIGLAAAPLGIVIVQALIVELSKSLAGDDGSSTTLSAMIGGMHAVTGIAVLVIAADMLRRARALASAPREIA